MRRGLVIILFVMMTVSACAVPIGPLKTAVFFVHAVDEENRPVSNALVWADFLYGYKSGWTMEKETYKVSTDTNGLCRMEGKSSGTVDWEIGKDGYYATYGPKLVVTNATLTHWQPIDNEYIVVMRPILNPIAMYVRELRMDVTPFPALDVPLAYDLEKGDWLAPHGNGQTADFIIRVHCDWSKEKSPYGEQYYNATLELTFSNEGDGIIEFRDSQPEREGSVFRLPRYAPESGYTNLWSAERFTNKEGSTLSAISQRNDLNYFFRVRTKKDEAGKIRSAHYGKIRGPLDFGFRGKRNGLGMTYYFNPTPNDRNMEFDPSRNLFTDLPVSDQVREP